MKRYKTVRHVYKDIKWGNCLVVQWLRLNDFTAMGRGSIPGQRAKTPQEARCGQKKDIKTDAQNRVDDNPHVFSLFLQYLQSLPLF